MSWNAAAFVILGVVLAAGFAWFERARPPARVVALVAALAALATVGRIAFAPFPNVKPTTDITVFAGYALGPVPGFMVGAIAALASNVFFGQGPFTPWQMTAWGMTGVLGALFAVLMRGREPGRWPLAIWCGLAGALFGAFMDLYQWTQGAGQDLAHYLAVAATSLPYNVAHVVGNVAFSLLLGPGFVRALRRYRQRFDVRWAAPAAAATLALLAALAFAAPPRADASVASRATAYVLGAQNADGGFGGSPGASSTQLHTGWAALGLAAVGRNPASVSRTGRSVIDYVHANAGNLTDTGDLERTILVLYAARLSPRAFDGRDLVAELVRRRSYRGSWDTTNHTAFGVFALRAGGLDPRASTRWLLAHQNSDGGYGFQPRASSDADDTGAVLEALAAGGRRGSEQARRAVAFLRRTQNRDGGWALLPGGDSNAQSTAWAVQGLVAAGVKPASVRKGGHSPLSYLASLQTSDGSVRYSRTSRQTPVWVTAQALDALERKAFPLRAAAAPSRAARAQARKSLGSRHQAAGKGRHSHAGAAPKHAAAQPVAPSRPQAAPPTRARTASAQTRHASDHSGPLWIALGALAGVATLATWRLLRRRRNRPDLSWPPPA